MGIVCKGKAVFQDSQSGQQVMIDADNLDWECVGSDERQMGAENCYQAEYEVQVGGRTHTITWSVYEYPVGVFNYRTSTAAT